MKEIDNSIDSKKSAAQKAEEIRQMATSTAEETRQTIGAIGSTVKQTAKGVRMISDLKNLESELQVSRKKVKRIKGREVEDMKEGLNSLSKLDIARANSVSNLVGESVEQVETMDSSLSSQVCITVLCGVATPCYQMLPSVWWCLITECYKAKF